MLRPSPNFTDGNAINYNLSTQALALIHSDAKIAAPFTLSLTPRAYSESALHKLTTPIVQGGGAISGSLSSVDAIDVYPVPGASGSALFFKVTDDQGHPHCCIAVGATQPTDYASLMGLNPALVNPASNGLYMYEPQMLYVRYTGDINVANPALAYKFTW